MTPDDERTDREAQVARLLQASAQSERAPAELRAAVDAIRGQAQSRRAPRLPNVGGAALRYASVVTAAVAALAVALVLVIGGGGGLSIAQAAALATGGPSAPAPAPYPGAPDALLSARVGDLRFPNWASPQGWHTTGQRTDRVGGRTVTTVYYANSGRKLAYSIVSAPALSGLNTRGDRYATMWQHGRTIVVWDERNHTCILSAAGVSATTLWKLAAATLS